MHTKFTVVGLAMIFLSAALAGCTSEKDPEPAPTTPAPITSKPAATPPAKPVAPVAPAKPLPANVYNQTAEFTMQNAPDLPDFNVSTAWTKLTITYFLNATSSCYVIGNELPTGVGTGSAPMITIQPPISPAFSFELPPGPGSCGTTSGVIKQASTEVANEVGLWTITVTGRGQNLQLALLVDGE